MPFEAMMQNFHDVHFVHINMNLFSYLKHDGNPNTFKWNCKLEHGVLKYDGIKNPKYLVSVDNIDKEDEDEKGTLIVSMIQKDSVKNRDIMRGDCFYNPIRVVIYKHNRLNNQYTMVDNTRNYLEYELE